ncbi:MAG: hypothetical protein II794_04870 [Oscillospiraceae bacterium]|nr:hypothetical protein [Oscillospiraceae bacterium]
MFGKEKCKMLKEIRRRVAEANDIPLIIEECTHKGNCAGTCPRCESELRYLERELEARQRLGKTVALAALCAGLVTAVGCTSDAPAGPPADATGISVPPPVEEKGVEPSRDVVEGLMVPDTEALAGKIAYVPEDECPTDPEIVEPLGGDPNPDWEGEPAIPVKAGDEENPLPTAGMPPMADYVYGATPAEKDE